MSNHWKTSCHEAGHAIVAVLYELPFDYVERGMGEDDGEVVVGNGPFEEGSDAPPVELAEWQQFYAAGAAAERIMFGSERAYGIVNDVKKHLRVERMLQQSRVDPFNADVGSAMKMLDRRDIEVVATKLVQTRKLNFDEVAKLIGYIPSWEK